MTGSAWVRRADGPSGAITVELRAVNGKNLHVKSRLPSELVSHEAAIETAIRRRLKRGTVSVVVHVERSAATIEGLIDAAQFAAAAERLTVLATATSLRPPTIADVLTVPGVLRSASSAAHSARDGADAGLPGDVALALEAALDQLIDARIAEGAATAEAMRSFLDQLESSATEVAERAPHALAEYRERLVARVNEFLETRATRLEEAAIVRELGLYADRVDLAEELQRIGMHVVRAREILDAGGQVGRQLEFLAQEFLREVNTTGSKAQDVAVAHQVVAMKSVVDKLREQCANLE